MTSRDPVSGYRNSRSGKWVSPYTRRSRGRRSNHQNPSGRTHPSKPVLITAAVALSVSITIGGFSFGPKVFGSGGGTGSTTNEVGGEGQFTVNGSPGNVQANFKHATVALAGSGFGGYSIPSFDNDCLSHSYGNGVQGFFRSHPCKWLARAYIVINETKRDAVIVAISWVDMPNVSLAIDYKHLVDTPGTGNITELSRDSGPYRNVIFNGNYYLSGIVGTAVWNAQAQPVGSIPAKILETVLNDSRQ